MSSADSISIAGRPTLILLSLRGIEFWLKRCRVSPRGNKYREGSSRMCGAIQDRRKLGELGRNCTGLLRADVSLREVEVLRVPLERVAYKYSFHRTPISRSLRRSLRQRLVCRS